MSFVCNRSKPRLGCAGVTSLELALVLAGFMFLMTAIFDLGRYFFAIQSMVTLMNDAARYEMILANFASTVQPEVISAWTGSTGSDRLRQVPMPPLLDGGQGTISVNFLNQNNVPAPSMTQMTVTVTYPFTATSPWLSSLSGTLTETATYSY
jgi:hypothetical protein